MHGTGVFGEGFKRIMIDHGRFDSIMHGPYEILYPRRQALSASEPGEALLAHSLALSVGTASISGIKAFFKPTRVHNPAFPDLAFLLTNDYSNAMLTRLIA